MNPKDRVGMKKAPLRFTPPALVIAVGEAMEYGALLAKRDDGSLGYGPYNWRDESIHLMLYLEGIERHVLAIRDGEDLDPDSGLSHWSHIAAGVAVVLDAQALGRLIDDRGKPGPGPRLLAEIKRRRAARGRISRRQS